MAAKTIIQRQTLWTVQNCVTKSSDFIFMFNLLVLDLSWCDPILSNYNKTPDKSGHLQCAGFIVTRPFTTNEAVVQSNQHQLISCQKLCIILRRHGIYNLRSPTLTEFLLWEQGVGLYADHFIRQYIWKFCVGWQQKIEIVTRTAIDVKADHLTFQTI